MSLLSSLSFSKYRPDVCFEKGEDIWKVKRPSHLSGILKYKRLTPLWCDNCSVNTTVQINSLTDPDRISENSLITLPKKCIPQQNSKTNSDVIPDEIPQKAEDNNIIVSEKVEPVEMQLVTFNKMLIKPFLTYKNLKAVESSQMSASLFSQMSYGVELGYQRSYNDRHALIATGLLAQYNFKARAGDVNIINNTPTLYKFGLDYKWAPNPSWAFRVGGRLSQNLFFGLESSASQVYLYKQNNFGLSIHPEWTFYRTDDFLAAVIAGYDLVLGSNEDSITSESGNQIELGAVGSYKLNWGRIQADVTSHLRDQTASQIKTRDTTLMFALGVIYLF